MAIHILGATGPKSIAGKNRSRMNAFKHGGYAKTKILPFESEADYKYLSKSMFDSYAPEDFAQRDLVQRMVDALWLIERIQLQAGFRRDEFCKELTPVMLTEMLGMDERFQEYAPEYLVNPNYKMKKLNRNMLATQLADYEDLMIKAKDVSNFDVVWKSFPDLFEGLHQWLPAFNDNYPPLIESHRKNLHIKWQNYPQELLKVLEIYVAELYYAFHFDSYRSDIRVMMASWFFIKKSNQHIDNVSNELIMKHQRAYQSLIDTYIKLRKSNDEHTIFIERLSNMRRSILSARDGQVEGEHIK